MKKINLIRVITTNEDIELVYFWKARDDIVEVPPNKQEAFLEIADIMRKHDILEIKAVNLAPIKEAKERVREEVAEWVKGSGGVG